MLPIFILPVHSAQGDAFFSDCIQPCPFVTSMKPSLSLRSNNSWILLVLPLSEFQVGNLPTSLSQLLLNADTVFNLA